MSKLLEDKLYLKAQLLDLVMIYYYDKEGDKNILSEENYDESKEENDGNFECNRFFFKIKNSKYGDDEGDNNEKNNNKKLPKIALI